MTDSSIPDIAAEPDKVVEKLEANFRLDLNEEEASRYMQQIINDSVSAFFPILTEVVHKYMQYMRK